MTFRQLAQMAFAKQRADWERTSLMAWLFYQANRDPKKSEDHEPSFFNPYADKSAAPQSRAIRVPITMLKTIFVKGKPNA